MKHRSFLGKLLTSILIMNGSAFAATPFDDAAQLFKTSHSISQNELQTLSKSWTGSCVFASAPSQARASAVGIENFNDPILKAQTNIRITPWLKGEATTFRLTFSDTVKQQQWTGNYSDKYGFRFPINCTLKMDQNNPTLISKCDWDYCSAYKVRDMPTGVPESVFCARTEFEPEYCWYSPTQT